MKSMEDNNKAEFQHQPIILLYSCSQVNRVKIMAMKMVGTLTVIIFIRVRVKKGICNSFGGIKPFAITRKMENPYICLNTWIGDMFGLSERWFVGKSMKKVGWI